MKTLNNRVRTSPLMGEERKPKKKEIESKFLIWEDGINYFTDRFRQFFGSPEELREVSQLEGTFIHQGYMPIGLGYDLARRMGVKVDFSAVEARLRRKLKPSGEESFTFDMKDDGTSERGHLEDLPIEEILFREFWPHTEGERLFKFRLKRPDTDCPIFKVEFDTYTDRDLIVAEVEFKLRDQQLAYLPLGVDITEDPNYKNRNMGR